jgi:hypothetical protein
MKVWMGENKQEPRRIWSNLHVNALKLSTAEGYTNDRPPTIAVVGGYFFGVW